MADVLDAGALFLVAGLCVVAVVGAADRLGQEEPASSSLAPDEGPTVPAADPSESSEVRTLFPGMHAADDEDGKHGHGHGKRDRGDDDGRRAGDGKDDDEDDEDDEEEDEGEGEEDEG